MAAQVVQVIVRGPLWPSLLSALDGFDVHTDAVGLTALVGAVEGQTQMLQMLALFHSLGIEVVSVNRLATTEK